MRDGTSAARAALGKPFYDWMHDDLPDAGARFDSAMRSLSTMAGPLIAKAVDLRGVRSVCDIGGGTGRVLRALLDAAPEARGTVFDLPDVVAAAGEVLGDLPEDRWEAVGGDFFDPDTIPTDQDRYLMQAIMHNWSDDQAGAILRNVRTAMAPGDRLWVVDSIVEPGRDDLAKATDMFMLVLTEGGRERTVKAWERLFRANGFRIESKVQLPVPAWVFTLAPVASA